MDGQDLITAAWIAGGALVALVVLALVLGRRRKPAKGNAKGPVRGLRPDRDILRAETAITVRGLEQRAEALAETVRRLRIENARLSQGAPAGPSVSATAGEAVGGDTPPRDAETDEADRRRIAALETALAEKTSALAATNEQLATARAEAEAAREAAKKAAGTAAAAGKPAPAQAAAAPVKTSDTVALSAARSEIARLSAEIAALKSELDRKAGVIGAAEAALSSATAALSDRDEELGQARAEAEAKASEAARKAQEAVAATRAAAEAKAALAQMQAALREAREEVDSRRIEAATAAVRADALADELSELRESGAAGGPSGSGPRAGASNDGELARLREELSTVAADVVAVAAEKDPAVARAVDEIVAGEPIVPAGKDTEPMSLAARIRRRRNREPA